MKRCSLQRAFEKIQKKYGSSRCSASYCRKTKQLFVEKEKLPVAFPNGRLIGGYKLFIHTFFCNNSPNIGLTHIFSVFFRKLFVSCIFSCVKSLNLE